MGKRFVFVTEDLWTDKKFLDLSTDARLLFMWAWMPPQASVCGLYAVAPSTLGSALGASQTDASRGRIGRVRDALGELESKGMVLYDWATNVIWVVNRVKYAARPPAAVNYMQREIRRVPDSPLVDDFISLYGPLLQIEGKK